MLAPVHMSKERRRDCWTIQSGTRFSPSRPCARRCAPCSASRLRRALTAALARAPPAARQSRRSTERVMKVESLYVRDERGEFVLARGEAILAAAKRHLRGKGGRRTGS